MKNKTYKREFTSHAFEAEINVKRVRVKIVQIQRNLESGADDIGRFKVKNMVRVLWATEDPPAWFVGRVDRVMPASIEVYYATSRYRFCAPVANFNNRTLWRRRA